MFNDLRYGMRKLLKSPGFTLVAVLTLALGIGVNTAIFSLINSLLLRPLPYRQPDQLVWIEETSPSRPGTMVMAPHFLDWSEQSQSLQQVAAYTPGTQTLTGNGEPDRLDVCRVSSGFFPLLGIEPKLGRGISADDDRPNTERIAVISHSLWQRRFNGSREVIGQSIKLDDRTSRIVGVLPPDFRFLQPFEIWVPLSLDPVQERGNQQISTVNAIARLKSGARIEQAQTELSAIISANRQRQALPLDGQVRLIPLHEKLLGSTKGLLFILLGAVNLVLLIACTNVANLLLSRGAMRQKEFAIRTALGAGRLQLIRQMLTESALLALAGAGLGLFLAAGLIRAFVAVAAMQAFGDIARMSAIDLDWRVLGFTLLVSGVAATLFGLVPAIQLSRPNIGDWLKERGCGTGSNRQLLRRMFMVVEVAFAIILLTGAGLLLRSFAKLLDEDPGYRSQHLLTMRISLPESRYVEASQRSAFLQDLLKRIAALPGVESAATINHLPLSNFMFTGWLRLPGQARQPGETPSATPVGIVSSGYFHTMGIRLRAGRAFTDQDISGTPRVVIVSESLARALFPNTDPLGKQLWVPGPGSGTPTVVGIVGDIKHQGLDKGVTPQVYVPYLQFPSETMTIVMHTTIDPMSLATAVRHEVLQMDRDLPVYELRTMEARLADSIASRRINLLLLALFASLALLLAAVGIYGVFTFAVTQRTQEFGVRLVLGATRSRIVGMVLVESLVLTLGGIVLGIGASLGLTRVMSTLLYGVKPHDPLTFALVCLILLAVALLAPCLPAWRAARVDPWMALRSE